MPEPVREMINCISCSLRTYQVLPINLGSFKYHRCPALRNISGSVSEYQIIRHFLSISLVEIVYLVSDVENIG